MPCCILPVAEKDRPLVRRIVQQEWGGDFLIVHGQEYFPEKLPGWIAWDGEEIGGVICYLISDKTCEVLMLNTFKQGEGIGSALMDVVEKTAGQSGCQECVLVTTNDNLTALGFYQKRGYCIRAVAPGALQEVRKRKPSIPLLADNGIPIRDEITLAKPLQGVG